jgi:predicted esterase
VGGVSWYEARAYARFVGKELPTVYEWNAAAVPEAGRWVVPLGRYYSTGPVRGGTRGVGPRGVYDLTGNVREWTVNATTPGNRYILGGGWNDPSYQYSEIFAQPELNRSATNGIRLVRRLGQGRDIARASAPVPGLVRDYSKARPVDDATFRGYLALYEYDRTPLSARVESRDTTNADWIRERVSFEAIPGARTPAIVFLPKHAKPPYQTALVWPASNAFIIRSSNDLPMIFVDFLVRSGRAVIFPVFDQTFERGNGRDADMPDSTIAHRQMVLNWAKEMRRSIDYLASRTDIDTTRLAFLGTSWGGRLGGVMVAVEPRFRTAILYIAGLGMAPTRPEEDPVNFLPRIHVPVLMLNGRYDSGFPYELSQKPFFNLLGSPPGTKKQIVFEGGHFLPRTEMVAASLRWLDEQFGVPNR